MIATMDTHGPDYLSTQEGRNLPVEHCIKGTDGWQLRPDIAELLGDAVIYEKPTFGSMELAKTLTTMDDLEELELIGLCTDICVVSSALLRMKLFWKEQVAGVDNFIQDTQCLGWRTHFAPSLIRMVRLISLGMTTRTKSSMGRTMTVAFLYKTSCR